MTIKGQGRPWPDPTGPGPGPAESGPTLRARENGSARPLDSVSAEGKRQLFLSEHRAEVAQVDSSIVAISPFWVDVLTSSERVRLSTETPRAEADDKIELRQVFGPTGLSAGEDLCSGEILKVLVVGDNVDQNGGAF
jgi:hypothetical protein